MISTVNHVTKRLDRWLGARNRAHLLLDNSTIFSASILVTSLLAISSHPRRPKGGQSDREKRRRKVAFI